MKRTHLTDTHLRLATTSAERVEQLIIQLLDENARLRYLAVRLEHEMAGLKGQSTVMDQIH